MRKEFGKYLLDVSKYIVTAVIISGYFSEMQERVAYSVGIILAILMVVVGLLLCQKEQPTTDKKDNKRRK